MSAVRRFQQLPDRWLVADVHMRQSYVREAKAEVGRQALWDVAEWWPWCSCGMAGGRYVVKARFR